MSVPASRQDGVDALRALGALAVVELHVGSFRSAAWDGRLAGALSDVLGLYCRLAVPFFFVASGYFFGRALALGTAPLALAGRQARRLLGLYACWSLAYLVVPAGLAALHHRSAAAAVQALAERTLWATSRPLDFVLQGPQEHLWFLPALACGLLIVAGLCAAGVPTPGVVGLGAALYLLALLGGAYAASPLGLHAGFNLRNGPFVATLFVGQGLLVARRPPATRTQASWLLLAGIVITTSEALLLLWRFGADVSAHDALAGLALAGPGLFLLGLHGLPQRLHGLARAGRLSLGVYALHMLLALPLLRLLAAVPGVPAELARPLLVYLLALGATWTLARSARLRPLVA